MGDGSLRRFAFAAILLIQFLCRLYKGLSIKIRRNLLPPLSPALLTLLSWGGRRADDEEDDGADRLGNLGRLAVTDILPIQPLVYNSRE